MTEQTTDLEKTADPVNKTEQYFRYLAENVIYDTRGARFTAARLLVLKERISLVIQCVLAVALIWVSVYLLAYPDVDQESARRLGIISTMSSVSILAIVLFEYALGRGLLASKLHESALRATALMRSIERELAAQKPSFEDMTKAAEAYEQENILTNVNHSAMDFKIHKYSRAKSKCGAVNIFYRARSFLTQAWVVAMAVWPGMLTLIVIAYQVYAFVFTAPPASGG